MSYDNHLEGQCHCGGIAFRFYTNIPIEELVPRACSCSFCTRHGARYISDPAGELELSYAKDAEPNRYRFGTETADFVVCKRCGSVVAALCEIDGKLHAVLNANNLLRPLAREPVVTHFDGECIEERLNRRAQTWTGKVSEAYHESRPVMVNTCG